MGYSKKVFIIAPPMAPQSKKITPNYLLYRMLEVLFVGVEGFEPPTLCL